MSLQPGKYSIYEVKLLIITALEGANSPVLCKSTSKLKEFLWKRSQTAGVVGAIMAGKLASDAAIPIQNRLLLRPQRRPNIVISGTTD